MNERFPIDPEVATTLIDYNRQQQKLAKQKAESETDPDRKELFENHTQHLEDEANRMVVDIGRCGALTYRGRRL